MAISKTTKKTSIKAWRLVHLVFCTGVRFSLVAYPKLNPVILNPAVSAKRYFSMHLWRNQETQFKTCCPVRVQKVSQQLERGIHNFYDRRENPQNLMSTTHWIPRSVKLKIKCSCHPNVLRSSRQRAWTNAPTESTWFPPYDVVSLTPIDAS